MIQEIIRIVSFLLPIPFMALFYVKTNKLDFLKKWSLPILFIPIFTQILFTDIGFKFELVLAYTIFVLFGAYVFNSKGWTYPQALSLSFCLAYFGSFLWELPTHIYTIIVRGGIDGAFPMHLLYIFPIIFIYEKVQTNRTKKEILNTIISILGFSTIVLIALLAGGYNIWYVNQNPLQNQSIMEYLWMFNRIIVIFGLFTIYIKSTVRKKRDKK